MIDRRDISSKSGRKRAQLLGAIVILLSLPLLWLFYPEPDFRQSWSDLNQMTVDVDFSEAPLPEILAWVEREAQSRGNDLTFRLESLGGGGFEKIPVTFEVHGIPLGDFIEYLVELTEAQATWEANWPEAVIVFSARGTIQVPPLRWRSRRWAMGKVSEALSVFEQDSHSGPSLPPAAPLPLPLP